jgi:hypothetical protein
VNRKLISTTVAILSWPVVGGLLYVTSSRPATGQRWADANPGRGSFLAATGLLWMTGLLLFIVWKFTFIIVVPRLAERQRRSHENKINASQTPK